MSSLLERSAIPEICIRYFTDPDLNIGSKKSRKEVFEAHGVMRGEIFENPAGREMRRRGLPVGTVAAVLAEIDREEQTGGRRHVFDPPAGAGRGPSRGHPRRRASGPAPRADRCGLGDGRRCFTVAVADLAGGAVVATFDPRDFGRLAAHAGRVAVADIG